MMALSLATKGMIYNQCGGDTGGGDFIDLPRPQRVYYKDLTIKNEKPIIIQMRLENESNT